MAAIIGAGALSGVLKFVFSGPGVATIGVGILLAFGGVQTLRLNHAKHDLTTARAALIDPAGKATWQSEEVRDRADLATCRANEITLEGSIKVQNASIEAQSALDTASLARSEAIVRQAQANEAATAKALKALSGPIATSANGRCAAFDKTFLESLK